MSQSLPDPTTRMFLTISALAAVMMTTLDGTIAIIALPRIQSNLSASHEQIAWVLTSYLVAAAIATPLSGWLADRFGRVRVMAFGVAGFTLASVACGLSANIEMLVVSRFLQGCFGACLVPLSQVLLLDIYPPERQGPAVAWFGIGSLMGPMIGPTLGAWLTEYFSWRWIFLINAPIGVMACIGLLTFGRDQVASVVRGFDARGFAMLSIALAAFQLMLDRGQLLDWFDSTEIVIEAAVAALFLYLFVVHVMSARDPFIKPAIFRDWNFFIGIALSIVLGVFLNGVIPIVTSMMQQLYGYPIMLAGYLSLPRAMGNMVAVFTAGRLVSRVEPHYILFGGMLLLVWSLVILSGLSVDSRPDLLALVALLQGVGSGFLFLPLMMIMFATLPGGLRNEASTVSALMRSLGGAVGISLIQTMTIRDTAAVQARLAEGVRPDSPLADWRWPGLESLHPEVLGSALGEVARQATMAAYVDSFRVLLVMAICAAPLALVMRPSRHRIPAANVPVHAD